MQHHSDEQLKSLQKAIVKCSLVGAKLKMAVGKPISLFIDWEQCLPMFPVVDIKF